MKTMLRSLTFLFLNSLTCLVVAAATNAASADLNPFVVGTYNSPGSASGVAVSGNYAFLADGFPGLQVVDISNPANPVRVGGSLPTTNAVAIAVAGNFAYLGNGSYGFLVFDVSTPSAPQQVGAYGAPGFVAGDVVLSGTHAYVAGGADGLHIFDISNPANPQRISGYNTPGEPAGIALAGHHAYVADQEGGLQIIDVSNPSSPQRVGEFAMPLGAPALDVVLIGNHAYVGCAYNVGLQILDVSNPSNPIGVGEYPGSPSFGAFADLTVSGNQLYVNTGQLLILDVSNPIVPVLVGRGLDSGGTDMAVSGTFACVAVGTTGMRVVDVSRPANPQRIQSYSTTNYVAGLAVSGQHVYTVSGLGFEVVDLCDIAHPQRVGVSTNAGGSCVVISGNIACVASFQRLMVVDIAERRRPKWVGQTFLSGQHVWNIATQGSNVFVAIGSEGLAIMDIGVPAAPFRAGAYDTPGLARGVAVSNRYAYVADDEAGLHVIDVINPANPQRVGGYNTTGKAWDVALAGNHAYVADGTAGLQIINVSNPANPQRVGGYNAPGSANGAIGVAVADGFAYVAYDTLGLQVIDVRNPANPQLVGGNALFDFQAWDVTVADDKVFVSGNGDSFVILDTYSPPNPSLAIDSPIVSEGHTGTSSAVVTLRLAQANASPVSVRYSTADHTAVAGNDYLATNGLVVFAPGQTTQTVAVTVLGDLVDEGCREFFYLRLSNPTNITLSLTQALCQIEGDDRAPVILQQPASATVRFDSLAGFSTNVTFSVQAISVSPLSYQWLLYGTPIPDANADSFTVTNVQWESQGIFTVLVSDGVNQTLSDEALLTIFLNPVITQAPLSQSVAAGGSVTLGIALAAHEPQDFVIRWRKGEEERASSLLSGTTDFLTLTDFQPADAGAWSVEVRIPFDAETPPVTRTFVLSVAADTDIDRLPDDWELAYGLNIADSNDADLDPDDDGVTNLREFIAGTNPTNALSHLRFDRVAVNESTLLEFTAVSNRTYTVEFTDDLAAGWWGKMTDVVARETNRVERVVDWDAALISATRYYRLVTPRQP